MPTPGSASRSRCACSSTSTGRTAGPAEKLKIRVVVTIVTTSTNSRYDLQVEDVACSSILMRSQSAADGAPSRLIRATAASAPSKTMFSVSCTLRLSTAQVVEDVREHAGSVTVTHDEHVRRRRAPREVDDVGHLPGLGVAADDPHRFGGNRLLRLVGRCADVVRSVHAGHLRAARRRTGRCRRKARSRRHRGRSRSASSCAAAGKRGMVDDLPACGVDEERAGLQPIEHVTIDQTAGFRPEREVDAQNVDARGDVGGRRRDRHRVPCAARSRRPARVPPLRSSTCPRRRNDGSR